VKGDYVSKFQNVKLMLHGFPAGSEFTVNGQPQKSEGSGERKPLSFQNENGKISIKW
jgi:hypothetical protein